MGAINQHLNQLLQKPVDRGEFLKLVGIAILAVIGVTKVLEVIGVHVPHAHSTVQEGYGRVPFGGN